MTEPIETTVTRLLKQLDGGHRSALDQLFPLVYGELRALAHSHRQRWHGDQTLGTTALVWGIPRRRNFLFAGAAVGVAPYLIHLVTAGPGNVWIVKDLIEAIEKDRQPLGSAYDGRAALEMILAVYESHRLGAAVDLPLKNRDHPLAKW